MDYGDLSLNLFEQFVDLTDGIFLFLSEYSFFTVGMGSLSIVINWALFYHHRNKITDHEFFFNNISITGRFEKPVYEMWSWIATAFLPIGLMVIAYSMFTGFKSLPFIATFGVKGNNRVKRALLQKAKVLQQFQ